MGERPEEQGRDDEAGRYMAAGQEIEKGSRNVQYPVVCALYSRFSRYYNAKKARRKET